MLRRRARSAPWRQIQADVYGHEVGIVEAEEGAAYGAALLAGVGARMWASVDEACASVVRGAKRVCPDADAATLNKNYAAYFRVTVPRATSLRASGVLKVEWRNSHGEERKIRTQTGA
jgi:sugar (pentulose or hexulose) kinase